MAAEYFNRLAKAYPDDYVPYLALGDLYTQTKQFQLADDNYQQAYKIAPDNPLIIANAANAAIEAQQIKLAGVWVNRAKGKMNDDPRVMRERERYLFHEGELRGVGEAWLPGAAAAAQGPQRVGLSGLRPLQHGPL